MIGKTISHYKIISKLGEGGMGLVYKAHDTKLDRTLALKFLPPNISTSDSDKARFLQEAKAASAINHPNVCVIHDIQEYDDPATKDRQQFIVMEYVEGETLSQLIKDRTRIQMSDCIDFALQIADALQTAHEEGIIHRDIKSDNIMVTSKGQVKVMDFGLAKLKGSIKLTKTTSTVGTLAYMSPEHLQGLEIDKRTDIFSFGVVLYEMITGQLPFKGEYESSLMYSILNEEPQPAENIRPDLSSEFLHILYRALEKKPEARYQSVNEILIDLRRVKRDSDKVSPKSLSDIPIKQSKKKSSFSQLATRLIAGFIAVAVILLTLFYFKEKWDKSPSFEQMQITRLTAHGKAKNAAISPNGRYIVHVMEDEGKESLWLRQVATNSNIQIFPPDDVSFKGLNFSSDGDYIYYTSQELDKTVPNLYRMPTLGGSSTKILENIAGPLTFSHDNKRIAFYRRNLPKGKTMLLFADVDGSNEKILAERIFPDGIFTPALTWSPDGNAIICGEFRKDIEACTLTRISVYDGKESIISSQNWRFINDIAFSTNSKNLIINASDRSYDRQIWALSYPDGGLRRITNDLNDYGGLSLTKEGNSMVTVQSEVQSTIWIVSKDGIGNARQITRGKYDGANGINWTMDGKIVYGGGDSKLWMINSDGSHPKRLSSDKDTDFLPSVSPDGQTIVFTSAPVSILEIWKMNIDGSHRTKLAGYAGDPHISPDGNWVIFTSEYKGSFTLWKVSIDGGDPIRLLEIPAVGSAISPDGKQIACFLGDDQIKKLKMAVLPFEGGKPELIFDLPQDFDNNSYLRWTLDGSALTYIKSQGGISNIWIQPLDGSPSKQLTNFKEKLIFIFDWSYDGTLACSRGQINNDVVLIKDIK